jgi:hypothetical protein
VGLAEGDGEAEVKPDARVRSRVGEGWWGEANKATAVMQWLVSGGGIVR